MSPQLCEQCWSLIAEGERCAANTVWLSGHPSTAPTSLTRWFHLECLAAWLAGQLPQAWHAELWERLAESGVSKP